MPLPQPLTEAAAELIADRFRGCSPSRCASACSTGCAMARRMCTTSRRGWGTTPQNVSKHLGVLAREGVVARRKVGNYALYRVVDDGIWELCHLVCAGVEQRLESLRVTLTA